MGVRVTSEEVMRLAVDKGYRVLEDGRIQGPTRILSTYDVNGYPAFQVEVLSAAEGMGKRIKRHVYVHRFVDYVQALNEDAPGPRLCPKRAT
jgi:hypothetical protein